MQGLSRRLARPVWWLVPIISCSSGAAPEMPGGPFVLYLFVFLLGFVAVCDSKFPESAERYRVPALVVRGRAVTVLGGSSDFRDSLPDPSWQRAGLAILGAAALWLMLIGAVGIGKRYLDRTSRDPEVPGRRFVPRLHPASDGHRDHRLLRGPASPCPQRRSGWCCSCAAVAGTFALYEIVRRVGVLRFLFGMRARKRA